MANPSEKSATSLATHPVPKKPILPSDSLTVRRVGSVNSSARSVYLFHDVAEELLFSSQFRHTLTAAGILTGGYFAGPAGEYVEVRGFHGATVLDSTLDFAEHLRRNWNDLAAYSDLVEQGLRPVGWFLSRPGCGGELGPFELIVHLSYFNLPYQVLLMLDPIERKLGLYISGENDHLLNIGFNLIEAVQGNGDPSNGNSTSESP